MILRLLFVALVAVGSAAAQEDTAESPKMRAMAICEQTVAEKLESTGSASWPSRDTYKIRSAGGGEFQVEGYVDMQGPLGDLRTPWRCHASWIGDRWNGNVVLGETKPAEEAKRPEPSSPPVVAPAPLPPAVERPLAIPESASVEPAAPVESWKDVASCSRIRFRDTYAERVPNQDFQIVRGTIEYAGTRPIRNVKVCALGVCSVVRGVDSPMVAGAIETFAFKVPAPGTPTVTAECSVLEP